MSLVSYAFKPLFNYISGLIFALQFFSFLAFCIYCFNEFFVLIKRRSFLQEFKKDLFKLLLKRGIITFADEKENEPITNVKAAKVYKKYFNIFILENFKQVKRRN
jgi:hypothetical protein